MATGEPTSRCSGHQKGDGISLPQGNGFSSRIPIRSARAGYRPLAPDFDGNGLARPAGYRDSDGIWYDQPSAYQGGVTGDVPLIADFDGDGATDLTVYRPSTGEWFIRFSSRSFSSTGVTYQWGVPGDIPMVFGGS